MDIHLSLKRAKPLPEIIDLLLFYNEKPILVLRLKIYAMQYIRVGNCPNIMKLMLLCMFFSLCNSILCS